MKPWALFDWLFPPRCALCGRFLWGKEKQDQLCPACSGREKLKESWKMGKLPFVAGSVCVYPYEGSVRRGVHRFKFRGAARSGEIFGVLLAQRVRETGLLEQIDLVCYVPCHPKVRRKRGYEQARKIAGPLAEELGLPLEPLLEKRRNTRPMYRLKAAQRRANVLGAFAVTPGKEALVRSRRVLVVDDVLTTGSTLSECARVLREAGAREVYGAAFARTFAKRPGEKTGKGV